MHISHYTGSSRDREPFYSNYHASPIQRPVLLGRLNGLNDMLPGILNQRLQVQMFTYCQYSHERCSQSIAGLRRLARECHDSRDLATGLAKGCCSRVRTRIQTQTPMSISPRNKS
ncbi:predicted protein, partial [Verticillium alfalfae VaMs.102]